MPFTLVQGSSLGAWGSASNGATPADPVAVTWAQGRGAGNLLLLGYVSDGVLPVPTGWTQARQQLDFADTRLCYRIAQNNADDTPTLDNNAATSIGWAEYSGNTASPLDQATGQNSGSLSGATSYGTGTTGTTAQADELAVAVWGYSVQNSPSNLGGNWSGQTNGFTERVDVGTNPSGTKTGMCIATLDLAATGAYTSAASITLGSGTNRLQGIIVTFKATVGGGGTPAIVPIVMHLNRMRRGR